MSSPEGEAPVGAVSETDGANVESATPTETAENPEWNSAWESLEKEPTLAPFIPRIKETLTPTFTKWDSDRRSAQEKYAPYEKYVEQGIKPELLEGSLKLYQIMDQNPRFIYDQLANHYGFTPAEAAAVAQDVADAQQEQEEQDGDVDPTYNALQAQIEELRNERVQEQQERLNADTARELDQGIKKVLTEHGKNPAVSFIPLDERTLLNLVSQELAVAEMTGAPYKYDLAKTYQKWVTEVNQYRAIPAPNQAPTLTPSGNSGLPVHTGGDSVPQEVVSGNKKARIDYITSRYGQH